MALAEGWGAGSGMLPGQGEDTTKVRVVNKHHRRCQHVVHGVSCRGQAR